MFEVRTISKVALSVLFVALATNAVPAESPQPSGKISVESTSIAVGIGVSWGDGKLTFKGKEYPFTIQGLTVVDLGISKASAVGDVYNLTDVSKLEGDYVAAEAGFALAGGMGGISMRNQNGVLIYLHSVSQGAKLQLGPSGMTIKLKK